MDEENWRSRIDQKIDEYFIWAERQRQFDEAIRGEMKRDEMFFMRFFNSFLLLVGLGFVCYLIWFFVFQ